MNRVTNKTGILERKGRFMVLTRGGVIKSYFFVALEDRLIEEGEPV